MAVWDIPGHKKLMRNGGLQADRKQEILGLGQAFGDVEAVCEEGQTVDCQVTSCLHAPGYASYIIQREQKSDRHFLPECECTFLNLLMCLPLAQRDIYCVL